MGADRCYAGPAATAWRTEHMQTKTITYTSELCNDIQLKKLIHDILGYHSANDCDGQDLAFLTMPLLCPLDILEQWEGHLQDECEEDVELSLEEQIKNSYPELVPLFHKLKECETQDIYILF